MKYAGKPNAGTSSITNGAPLVAAAVPLDSLPSCQAVTSVSRPLSLSILEAGRRSVHQADEYKPISSARSLVAVAGNETSGRP